MKMDKKQHVSNQIHLSRVKTRQEYQRLKKTKNKRSNFLKKYLNTPKGYVFFILLMLMALGEVHDQGHKGLIHSGVAVGTAFVLDLIIGLFQKRKKWFPDGGIVTGLIVSLVLSPIIPMYQVVVITLFALLSKHLLVVNRKPIFNPAAFGLLLAIYVFKSGESWWGGVALLPAWCIIFLVIAGFLITKKVNKFPQVLSFLGVYFGLFLGVHLLHYGQISDIYVAPYVNSALFLAFFMLTDPPTSPGKYGDQVLFGILTALISVLSYLTLGGLSYLLVGLIVANGWKAWRFRKGKVAQKNKKKLQGSIVNS